MAATRPSSAIRAGSSDSSSWWETKEFARFTETEADFALLVTNNHERAEAETAAALYDFR